MKEKITQAGITNTLIITNLVLYVPSLILNKFMGNSWYYTIRHVQLWRLITALFSHASLLHLGANMFALLTIGTAVELTMKDNAKYIFDYFLCGILAGLTSIILDHNVMVVGASGAIYGLLGIYLKTIDAKKPVVVLNFILLLITGFQASNVDVVGHLAGLMVGLFISSPIKR